MRDDRRFSEAATLYGEALALAPGRSDLHIQCGHMLKEIGLFEPAEHHYEQAHRLTPYDPDLALQRGHFYKVAGRLGDAERAYQMAIELKPGWREPATELASLRAPGQPREDLTRLNSLAGNFALSDIDSDKEHLLKPVVIERLIPALAPRPPGEILHDHGEGLEIRFFGRPEWSFWGNSRTVRGVEAIRGQCVAPRPITDVVILLNGLVLYRGPVRGGYQLAHERDKSRVLKYVFNVWVDFGQFTPGRYSAEIRCTDLELEQYVFHDDIVIAQPLPHGSNPNSDAEVPISEPDVVLLEQQIHALPSVVRKAERTMLPEPPKTILIMRTDQLGDMVSSTPAVRRLREILPNARFIGMLTAANADLARTLKLFDEIVVIDFPDDPFERRRVMPLAAQEALRQQLEAYHFDLAIDLSQSDVSRPLLLLSGAPFRYGVGGGDWPWLTGEFGLNTHDPRNRLDRVPHSAKTMALVETLGALLRDSFEVITRDELDRRSLEKFGIGMSDRYVILHTGARIEFSRWPHFRELALKLMRATDWHVILMTDDLAVRRSLPEEFTGHPRFRLIDERLSFDVFDLLISFADAVVGNDSGPKHLASLRGTPAVTLFTARINWMEWGQERGGVIISRRVPCAGCALFHDPEECGKDFTCIRDIGVDEVFDAVLANNRSRAVAT